MDRLDLILATREKFKNRRIDPMPYGDGAVWFKFKTCRETYFVAIYPPNYQHEGKYLLRMDTKDVDNLFLHESLDVLLDYARKTLYWTREVHQKIQDAYENEPENANQFELGYFINGII